MDRDLLNLLISVGGFLALLGLGFSIGTLVERRHYASIRAREKELRSILLLPTRYPPAAMVPCRQVLVVGSVVIGMDYFKRTLAALRNLVGGSMGSYESLYDRARREAILRMKEEARKRRASCVLNIKFTTANVLSGDKNNKGFGCLEVVAYGTALIPGKR